jgi:predicted aspartyl protease
LQAVVEDRQRYGIVAPSRDADEAALRRCRVEQPNGVGPLPVRPSFAAPSVTDLRASEEEIPLRRQGNTYSVPVLVNGIIPIPFVLDTGAGDVLLPADVVFTLLRTGTLQSTDFISHHPYILADGRELPSAQFKIRELQVGQHTARNVIAGVGRLGSDALFGQSFLSGFGSATIDYKRNVLVLSW